eukprot:5926406-Alexandrium_andersonii.AAC.1
MVVGHCGVGGAGDVEGSGVMGGGRWWWGAGRWSRGVAGGGAGGLVALVALTWGRAAGGKEAVGGR